MSVHPPGTAWHADVLGKLHRTARQRPDHPAVIDRNGTTSFRSLYLAAARQAQALESRPDHGAGVAALRAAPSAAFFIQVCATLMVGRTPLVLPARVPEAEALRTVQTSRRAGCRPWKAVLAVSGHQQVPVLTHGESPAAPRKARALGMRPGGRAFFAAPMHLNGPFEFALRQLLLGGCIILAPRFEAEQWLESVRSHKPDWAFLVPTQIHQVWDARPPREIRSDCSSLRLLLHSSAPCPPPLRQRLTDVLGPERVAEYYGTTLYDGTFSTYTSPSPGGTPLPDTDLRIVDPSRRPVAAGIQGTIEGRSRTGLISHRTDQPCAGRPQWQSVGDLGRRIKDTDRIEVTDVAVPGRAIVAGVKIAVAETHATLSAHSAVRDCEIHVSPHDRFGSVLSAVVHTEDPALTPSVLRTWCAQRLTSPQRPHTIELHRTAALDHSTL
ncbi:MULTISPECIES: AMP-binding protein [Streptomyces]|uniref:AMP-binding protein n=1 Tax=Streptomyces griseiscabiei TaxID=2993540 RepID=A0ABU4LDW3_9ACTN|nr:MULTISPECIES: AMP-binding protein [Streptomyces]MBZ3908443.1 AMP-binding protein [Streptomyces griseiscabiei]MDX2913961.1 AMP-binding protein [Streptomyces griseiscabiei]